MSDSEKKDIAAGDLAALARAARLELASERYGAVAAALTGSLAQFDSLDDVDLGEIAPTNSFDPRWRDLA